MAAKAPTKSEVYGNISKATGLSRKQVASCFEALGTEVKKAVSKKGPGIFTLPGLAKIVVRVKPATKGGMKPNPFKPGEMMEVKAKPATRVVKVRALKSLKEMAK